MLSDAEIKNKRKMMMKQPKIFAPFHQDTSKEDEETRIFLERYKLEV